MIVLLRRSGLGHHSEAFADVDGDTLQREYGGVDMAVGRRTTKGALLPIKWVFLYSCFPPAPSPASAEMPETEMLSHGLSASEATRLIAIRDDAAKNGIIQYAFKGSRSSIV